MARGRHRRCGASAAVVVYVGWPPTSRERVRARFRAWSGCCPRSRACAPAYLVGGAVRDLLLGAASVDLDVAVEGDARRRGARRWPSGSAARPRTHERFGTATVRADDLAVDLASTRRETYERPGRAAGGGARGARRGPGPARLHGERDGDRPDGRRAAASCTTRTAGAADLEAGADPRAARRELPRRPDPAAARAALRGAAGLRAGPRDRAAGARGGRGGALAPCRARACATSCCDLLAEAEAPAAVERLGALGHRRGAAPGAATPTPSWWPARSSAAPRRAPTGCWPRWPRWSLRRARPLALVERLALPAGRARPRAAGGRGAAASWPRSCARAAAAVASCTRC